MGILYALMSAVGFSLADVMVKKGTNRLSKNNGAFASILLTGLISGVIFIVLGLSNGFPIVTWKGFLWFCLSGILTTFLGRTLLYSSIQHLGAVRGTAVKRLNPLFAVLLGITLLGEPFNGTLLLGMTFIFLCFGLLIYDNYKTNLQVTKGEVTASLETGFKKNDYSKTKFSIFKNSINSSYLFGALSALCYAFGYVVRKMGLSEISDPFFGAMLGAGVGIVIFVIMAFFNEKSKISVKQTFRKPEFWLVMAGLATSFGQISFFLALNELAVSRVALITSSEVVLTLFLTTLVFKNAEKINLFVIFAALFSMLGTMIIALG